MMPTKVKGVEEKRAELLKIVNGLRKQIKSAIEIDYNICVDIKVDEWPNYDSGTVEQDVTGVRQFDFQVTLTIPKKGKE